MPWQQSGRRSNLGLDDNTKWEDGESEAAKLVRRLKKLFYVSAEKNFPSKKTSAKRLKEQLVEWRK